MKFIRTQTPLLFNTQFIINCLLRLSLLSCVVFLSSCFSASHAPSQGVSIALQQYPKTLDPRITTDATGQRLNQLIFQSFVKFDRNLTIIPDAVKSWTFIPSTITYEFELLPDLTFSNQTPVTCDDIIFSLNEFRSETSPFRNSFQAIQDVTCKDLKVSIKLKEFSATLLTDLTVFKILPKKTVLQFGDQFGEHLIGSGPYVIEKLEFNEIVLKKRSDVTAGKIPKLIFKIIQDDGTRFLNAYKGAIDLIPMGIPLNKISYIKQQNKYQILTYPAPSMNYLLVNFRDPILSQKHVREAIAYSVNVSDIIKYKMEGYGEPATTILPPSNYFYNHSLKPYHHNLPKAQSMWAKIPIKELVLKTSNNPEVVEISKVLVEQFRNAGLQVKTQSYEWGTFYGDIKKGQFQIAMMRWVGITDPDIYRLAFHSQEFPPGRNRGFYKNSALDTLLLEGARIQNQEKRKKHYDYIQQVLLEDLAIIPLWYNTQVDLVSHRILDYRPAMNGDFTPFLDMSLAK